MPSARLDNCNVSEGRSRLPSRSPAPILSSSLRCQRRRASSFAARSFTALVAATASRANWAAGFCSERRRISSSRWICSGRRSITSVRYWLPENSIARISTARGRVVKRLVRSARLGYISIKRSKEASTRAGSGAEFRACSRWGRQTAQDFSGKPRVRRIRRRAALAGSSKEISESRVCAVSSDNGKRKLAFI